jgi:anti-sigma B factor antagonist
MNINVRTVQGVTVVELAGELTGKTAPETQRQILDQVQPGCKMLLDMSRVSYMSSAGLRLLLIVYRAVAGRGGRALLVGLSEDIESTMTLTGFLDFFSHKGSLEEGLADLAS